MEFKPSTNVWIHRTLGASNIYLDRTGILTHVNVFVFFDLVIHCTPSSNIIPIYEIKRN